MLKRNKLAKTENVKEELLANQALAINQQNDCWTPKPKLLRDVINGVCHHCHIKCHEQWKSDPNINVHAADETLEKELKVNQYFAHRFISCICIHMSCFKLTFLFSSR